MFLKKSLEKKLEQSINYLDNNNIEKPENKSYIIKASEKRKAESNTNKILFFQPGYKRFSEDSVKPQARVAKKYIEELRDPDILELQQTKRWNASSKVDNKNTSELSKTLFEVRHGLKDVNIVKLKDKKIEMGTDSRDICYVGWNNSIYFSDDEKKKIEVESLEKAFRNTAKSWYDITEKNKVFGGTGTTFYSKGKSPFHPQKFCYKSPPRTIEEKNNLIRKIKEENKIIKEDLRTKVKYEFPAASNEKISAIVYKRMNETFNSELEKTLEKPWRKHVDPFRNTKNTFHTMNMTSKTGFGKENFEKDKFNITGFSNNPFMRTTAFGSTNGFNKPGQNFGTTMTTGISFFNKTQNSGGSNKSEFVKLPSHKKDYYPKSKWIIEEFYHPGKWVYLLFRH